MAVGNKKPNSLKTFSYISFMYYVLNVSSCYEPKDGNNSTISRLIIDEGSPCQQSGLSGNCTRLTQCGTALDELKMGRNHGLLRCGFVKNEEIVCCPHFSERNQGIETTTIETAVIWPDNRSSNKNNDTKTNYKENNKTKRKCELMCEKMYKEYDIKPDIEFHVLNGEDAKLGQFPHMAALGYLDDNDNIDWRRCGASLISPRFLLTAAHCIICSDCSDPVKVRFGVVDITDNESAQDIDVADIVPGDYDITSRHNDIAIIELKTEVRITKKIYPACLYASMDDPLGLQVSGWGQIDQKNLQSRSRILQFAPINPVPINQCNTTILSKNKFTAKVILNTQLCAISSSDACAGDSGGPLQRQNKKGGYDIVGIVSYGIQCGTPIPGIYTRVSAYLDWIEEKVWPPART